LKTISIRERLLASSMITGVALAALSAGASQAQTAAAGAAAASGQSVGTVQEVVVTGSRIRQPNLTSVSPLATVSSAQIQQRGTTNIEDVINQLPQALAAQTSQVSNGASGTATVNLRGIGPQRTLVLVDGKRIPPGDPIEPYADLNFIPSAVVDRVDVVTGGASAVYGSDAIAGVVNFIMKKDFQGAQVDYQYGFFNHQNGNKAAQALNVSRFGYTPGDVLADGMSHNVSIVVGANSPDGKGNITAYAAYRHLDPVLQGDRDYSYCGIATTNNTQHLCVGSSNSAYGRFDKRATNPVTGALGTAKTYANNPANNGTFIPYNSSLAYNFNPLNYFQRKDETYSAGYFAHYKASDLVEVYSDFMFLDDHTPAQIAPSGLFRGSGPNLASGYTFNCNNPLMSLAQAQALCPGATINPGAPGGQLITQSIGYRFQGQPRISDIRHTDYKIDVGMRGDLGDGWHYDAYLQYGTAILQTQITGYASETKVQNALNVINDANGHPVCVSGGSCVPLNIFQPLSQGITPAALNYALLSAFTTGNTTQQVANFSLTGDLGQYGVKSPWAAEGVGVAGGFEYRRDTLTLSYDSVQSSGDLSGAGGQVLPVNGVTDTKEIFFEARIPVAHGLQFAYDANINGAYRHSVYSLAGSTDTYEIAGDWSPIADVRLRASFNHAVRAPNIRELFLPVTTGLAGYTDPCAVNDGASKPSATLAQCLNTGMTAAQYGNVLQCASAQCSATAGGNVGLKPEDADTYSVGAVFQPSFFTGFSASVDYFNIKVNNVISAGVAPPTQILTSCLNDATSPFCSDIHRDASGNLSTATGYVDQTNANAGYISTDGIDVALNYRYPLDRLFKGHDYGSLNFSFVGTYTLSNIAEPYPGSGTYNCVGLYGLTCGSPQSDWKHVARLTWNSPWHVSTTLSWRFLDGVTLDGLQSNPLLYKDTFFNPTNTIDAKIGAYNYLDLAIQWKVKDGLVLRGGINNVLDEDPPVLDANNSGIIAPPYGNGNTYPGTYDALGRQVFVGLTANF
jgi:outer membrane receptor protein involved in Fe transport